jgi:YVTN family beta-propeller protein
MKRTTGNDVCLVLLLGMALLAIPSQAQNFAYVTNDASNSVSVIDTASNTVVATVTVGSCPLGVAITRMEPAPMWQMTAPTPSR